MAIRITATIFILFYRSRGAFFTVIELRFINSFVSLIFAIYIIYKNRSYSLAAHKSHANLQIKLIFYNVTGGYLRMFQMFHHIEKANNIRYENYLPLHHRMGQIGWIKRQHISVFEHFTDLFECDGKNIYLLPGLPGLPGRDQALLLEEKMLEFAQFLHDRDYLLGWWGEKYRLTTGWHDQEITTIERGLTPFLGAKSWGVHLNGYLKTQGKLFLWVAKRSMSKRNDPGKLDNIVAGGQPAGLSLRENLAKEAAEEAGISSAMIASARAAGVLSYVTEMTYGVKQDQIFVYDLEVQESFIPKAIDGEVEAFQLMEAEEILEILATSDAFKYNCALVYLDFFIRHGILTADNCADYIETCLGLHH